MWSDGGLLHTGVQCDSRSMYQRLFSSSHGGLIVLEEKVMVCDVFHSGLELVLVCVKQLV
ncbi:hypothetical protein DPMN_176416 [Dreissena polymorpha]|uniref:Uncharacterized protein n=1 Tax=Dreissena polymorpha TaxID=45954 RepID=A0A9D4EAY3_DREPO|nr:hypothetical protein DPMN_176416 [Dreissena polymorpha]